MVCHGQPFEIAEAFVTDHTCDWSLGTLLQSHEICIDASLGGHYLHVYITILRQISMGVGLV